MQSIETSILAAFVLVALIFTRLLRKDPLGHFPGPTLARRTWLYRAYYDIVIGGGWLSHLENLHKTYGPVVRVGRNELHFSDPAAYTDIYNSPYKMLKDPGLYRDAFQFGIPPNSGTVCDPKIHSALKSLIASYFSRKNILKLEDIIQERVDRLISQLVQNHRSTPANMTLAFRSVALDVISLYTLRTSTDTTSFPAFSHPRVIGTEETVSVIWMTKHLTFLKHLALRLPSWLAVYISPAAKPHLEIQAEMENAIDEATAYSESKLAGGHHDQDDDDDVDRLNIFYAILRNSRVEGKLKYPGLVTKDQMISEAFGLRIAGSDTIANACMIGTRYLIQEDGVREKLAKELETAWPDRRSHIPLERLEKLPYLTAVIKESLRFSSGIVTPMTRVAPESGAVIAGHPVPPGTVVSIGNTFVHMNLSIFPEPKRFYPERWLDDKNHNLDQYLVAFGKGPRSCLGINLAWSELYIILGNVFRKLEFRSESNLQSEVQFKEYFEPLYSSDVLSATVNELS